MGSLYAERMTHPLLEGPRGRYLIMSAITEANQSVWSSWLASAHHPDDEALRVEVVRAIAAARPPAPSLSALASAVDAAMYWQQPSNQDEVLVRTDVIEALEPVAERLAEAAPRWWTEPMSPEQAEVRWTDGVPKPHRPTAAEALAQWKSQTLTDEIDSRQRPSDPSAPWSGRWWSSPLGCPSTTRAAEGLAAIELALVEDGLGWRGAAVTKVKADVATRVLEIAAPEDWIELVDRYPLDVSLSRRHDWFRATGMDVAWAVPDWTLVANDVDAVHLTVTGYLTIAGRALECGQRSTVLAGWNPDQTFWLNERFTPVGAPTQWRRGESDTWKV
jgi:hypothetical protein